jgi:hypothetical protein
MSCVITQPKALTSATEALHGIGSSMSAQNAAAAAIHEILEHPRYQRRIACGRRGCQRGRAQLTKTSRLSTDTYRDPA